MDEQLRGLYPDLAEAGGLAALVEAELARHRAGHGRVGRVTPRGTSWAVIDQGTRSVQMTVAVRQRLFLADLWNHGVELGSLSSPDPGVVTQVIHAFLTEEASVRDVGQRFPSFVPTPQAEAHEAGASAEVAAQWESVKQFLRAELPELVSLADTLSQRTPFSRLFPFVSQDALCFSRCTGYPYSGDCPVVVGTRPGHFEVRSNRGQLLGEGGEEAALAALDAALPPGCGPAVQGTASDLGSEADRASA